MIEKKYDGHTYQYYTVQETAKILKLKTPDGRNIGRNLFLQLLRNNKIVDNNNFLYQSYINLDLGAMHMVNKGHHHYAMPLFTPKGINYINSKIERGDINLQVLVEIKNDNVKDINDIC